MTTPPLDIPALRDIANAATEGEWWTRQFEPNVIDIFAGDGAGGNPGVAEAWHPEDARHITAFDPPTALALLDRVTAAESSLARYIVERTRFGDAMAANAVAPVVDAIMRELTEDADKRARESTARAEAAEAKVAAVREPAGFVVVDIKTRKLDWDGELHPTREDAIKSLTGPFQSHCRTPEEETDELTYYGKFYEILPVALATP